MFRYLIRLTFSAAFLFIQFDCYGRQDSLNIRLDLLLRNSNDAAETFLLKQGLSLLNSIQRDPVLKNEFKILSKEVRFQHLTLQKKSESSLYKQRFFNLMGAYYESVSDYDKSLRYLWHSLSLNKLTKSPADLVYAYNYLGYVHWHKSNYDSAFYYHWKGRELILKETVPKAISGFNFLMLGNDYFDVADYVKTSENYFEGLKIYENLKDTVGMILTHNRLGKLYYKLRDLKTALIHINQALTLNRGIGYIREEAFSFNSLGNIYIERGKIDSALIYFTQTARLHKACKDIIGQSIASINLGDTYLSSYKSSKSPAYLDSSFHYYRLSLNLNTRVDNKFGMIYGYWGMGDNSVLKGEYSVALQFYNKAVELSRKINALSEEYNLYWKIHSVYENINKDSSFYYLKKFVEGKSNLENEERTKEMLRQESRYQIEKKIAEEAIKMEQQSLLLEEKNKWKNYLLLAVILIVLILTFLVFTSIRKVKVIDSKNQLINSINVALSAKNKEITDSISYAQRIQKAILPPVSEVKKVFPDSFVLYKPKDIVAGDFYWMEKQFENLEMSQFKNGTGNLQIDKPLYSSQASIKNGNEVSNSSTLVARLSNHQQILFAVADCTGHGVPGAMVSVICNNALNRSVREYGLTDPGKILDKTRGIVIQEFEKSDEDVRDGMDISLCSLLASHGGKKPEMRLQWAGANNPLWILRNNEIIEYKSDKQPIGKYTENKPFTTHSIDLQKGDSIYIFTDGYVDQFGGENGKKFKAANLKNLLLSIKHERMDRQKEILNESFETWRGNLEQVDDVCVLGVRI